MERPPTPTELEAAKVALEKENLSYDPKSMRMVRKPMMDNLLEFDRDNTRYLIDICAKTVVNTYVIAQRPSTC